MSDPERQLAAKGRRDLLEAAIFAAADGLTVEDCAAFLARNESVAAAIALINAELESRPYEIVRAGGRYRFRTRPSFLPPPIPTPAPLTPKQTLLLTAIAYFQPLTMARAQEMLGAPPSRDALGVLMRLGYVRRGVSMPGQGAPQAYITSDHFLATFGFNSLADLPDMELLRDVGHTGPRADLGEIGRLLQHPDYFEDIDQPGDEDA